MSVRIKTKLSRLQHQLKVDNRRAEQKSRKGYAERNQQVIRQITQWAAYIRAMNVRNGVGRPLRRT